MPTLSFTELILDKSAVKYSENLQLCFHKFDKIVSGGFYKTLKSKLYNFIFTNLWSLWKFVMWIEGHALSFLWIFFSGNHTINNKTIEEENFGVFVDHEGFPYYVSGQNGASCILPQEGVCNLFVVANHEKFFPKPKKSWKFSPSEALSFTVSSLVFNCCITQSAKWDRPTGRHGRSTSTQDTAVQGVPWIHGKSTGIFTRGMCIDTLYLCYLCVCHYIHTLTTYFSWINMIILRFIFIISLVWWNSRDHCSIWYAEDN